MKTSLSISIFLHGLLIYIFAFVPIKAQVWQMRTSYLIDLVHINDIRQMDPSEQTNPSPIVEQTDEASVEMQSKSKTVSDRIPLSENPKRENIKTVSNINQKSVFSSQINVADVYFPFNYYLGMLQRFIEDKWKPPIQIYDEKTKLHTVLRFEVMKNGDVVDVVVTNSSGDFSFDQSAQRAVSQINPLPPLPDGFFDQFLVVYIQFQSK
jgi:TonB family protein